VPRGQKGQRGVMPFPVVLFKRKLAAVCDEVSVKKLTIYALHLILTLILSLSSLPPSSSPFVNTYLLPFAHVVTQSARERLRVKEVAKV
jgi:hypothetical protein